ncbi:hypothetical protein BCR34DRAFT_546671 [Clohesyomyces aquaticus]|uniref:Xylanolytic transcriptional activator regulatory domain-containing protein n=1 Tax=Clohesyomyces aquaticus TaxID=1231657 RepID=A0A1Y1YS93_9PLEO|nr:hypothetical protein BCR34DRAFT_546671 [Clohesyomyces aquaticus]
MIAEYESRIQRLESLLEERSAAQPTAPDPPSQDFSQPLPEWVDDLQSEIRSLPVAEGPSLAGHQSDFGAFDDELGLPDPYQPGMIQTTAEPTMPTMPIDFMLPPEMSYEVPQEISHLTSGFGSGAPRILTASLSEGVDEPPSLNRKRCDGYLPPPELGASLLKEFLVDFNTATPLYRPWIITEHLRKCFMGGSDGTPLFWANVYVVFGLAHRLRAMSTAATPQDTEMAEYYLNINLGSVSNLLLAEPSLALIQCLLGIATLLQTSSHSTSHALFVSTALRMAQWLSYNDDQSQPEDSDRDIEQQRRVFWIAFTMDTDTSLLSNAPTTHRRDDVAASYPETNLQDDAGAIKAADGNWSANIFSLRIGLSLLQAEAMETVLSINGRRRAPQESIATAQGLLQKLGVFHSHELFQFNAEQLMQLLYQSDIVHTVCLEASYFTTLFRLKTFLDFGMDHPFKPFSSESLNNLVGMAHQPCYNEARRFLSLLSVAPMGDIGLGWMAKLPIIAALCVVLAQATQHPSQYTPLPAEMHNYADIIQLLAVLSHKSKDAELKKNHALCAHLYTRIITGQGDSGCIIVRP